MPHNKKLRTKSRTRKNPFLPSKSFSSNNKSIPFFIIISIVLIACAAFKLTKIDRSCLVSTGPIQTYAQEANTPQEFLLRGDVAFDSGNCKQAIMNYTAALSLNPEYAEAYNNRAYVYMRQQNYGPALQDLDQAIRLRPNYIHALMNRADIHNYYFAQDKHKAIADYDKIIALGDTTGSVCGHRAVAIYGLRGRGGWNAITYLQLMQKTPEEICAMQE